jgi:hypothetical protein
MTRECQRCGRCLFTSPLYVAGGSLPFCLAILLTSLVSAYVCFTGEETPAHEFIAKRNIF